jgi:hypothetical protein
LKTLAVILLTACLALFAVPAQAAPAHTAPHANGHRMATAHKPAPKPTAHKPKPTAHKTVAHKAPHKPVIKHTAPKPAPVDCTPRKGMAWPAQCQSPSQWVDYLPGLTASQIDFCQHPYLGGAWAGWELACQPYR